MRRVFCKITNSRKRGGYFFIFAQNFKIKKIFEIFKNPPSLASNINTPTTLLCKASLYTVINKKCGWPFLKTKRGQVKCPNPECNNK